MTQKTISLSERVFKLLKNEKREGESYSNVIERLVSKKKILIKYFTIGIYNI